MDIEKLIEQLNDWNEKYISNLCGDRTIKCEEYCIKDDCLIVKAATALSTFQIENQALRNAANGFKAENEKLRAKLEQAERCIEIVEKQRDVAIKELENYMVQDVLDGNEPCKICAKASDIPCEYCNPKWRGPQKED